MSTAAPQPRTRDRDRRRKIISAATHLFRTRGFHAVGMDEVGEAAGITGPGVYRYFAGKDDLLVSVFEEATDDLWQDLGPGAAEGLETYVSSHVAYVVSHAEAIERRTTPVRRDMWASLRGHGVEFFNRSARC